MRAAFQPAALRLVRSSGGVANQGGHGGRVVRLYQFLEFPFGNRSQWGPKAVARRAVFGTTS